MYTLYVHLYCRPTVRITCACTLYMYSLPLPCTHKVHSPHAPPPLWTTTSSDKRLWYVKVPHDINGYGHPSKKVGLGQKQAPIWETTNLIKSILFNSL